MSNDILNPPVYCPDAIATDVGWINPKNGELLVTVRNLRQKIAERDLGIAAQKEVTVEREVNKSTTEKILDALTDELVQQKNVEPEAEKSVTIERIDNNIELSITESTEVEESMKPRRPGRPKKVKA